MLRDQSPQVGFERPRAAGPRHSERALLLEFTASVALAVSTIVAAAALTIGYARAEVLAEGAHQDGGVIGSALLVGLLLAGMGGLTAFAARGRSRR